MPDDFKKPNDDKKPESPETPPKINDDSQNDPLLSLDNEPVKREPETAPINIAKPFIQEPKKKSKKWLIMGVIVAILAILGLGSGAAYAFWYQNPDKVIGDSLVNAITARSVVATGTMKYESGDVTTNIAMDSKNSHEKGSTLNATISIKPKDMAEMKFEGESMYDVNGDVYFKAKNLSSILDTTINLVIEEQVKEAAKESIKVTEAEKKQIRTLYTNMFGPIVKKVDNKWVKISVNDMESFSKEFAEEYKCAQNVMKKLSNDAKVATELSDIYAKNKFIVVKENLGTKEGSMGYVIDVNKDTAKNFGKAIEGTAFYKELKACSKNATTSSPDEIVEDTKISNGRTELWVEQWNHHITSFKSAATLKEEGAETKWNMDVTTKFNTTVDVTAPKDTISLKDLTAELQSLFLQFGAPAVTDEQTLQV